MEWRSTPERGVKISGEPPLTWNFCSLLFITSHITFSLISNSNVVYFKILILLAPIVCIVSDIKRNFQTLNMPDLRLSAIYFRKKLVFGRVDFHWWKWISFIEEIFDFFSIIEFNCTFWQLCVFFLIV